MLLTPTNNAHPVEEAAPGSGRNGVGVEGGAPTRYEVTNRGQLALSPWSTNPVTISYMNLGTNSISNLQVVSQLNLFNQARHMYHYNYQSCPSNYYPKLYLGTVQTTATSWNHDRQNIENHPSIWPEIKPQKGEANK